MLSPHQTPSRFAGRDTRSVPRRYDGAAGRASLLVDFVTSRQGVDMGRGEGDERPDPKSLHPGRCGLTDQLAAKSRAFDAGDPDQHRLARERSCAGQERELDEVADGEPANVFPKHDIINAHLVPPLLDVLDLYAVPHDGSFRQPEPK